MPPFLNIQSAVWRRLALIFLSPILLIIMLTMHLGKEFADALSEFRILFRSVWRGKEEERMMLPCPFCGGDAVCSAILAE